MKRVLHGNLSSRRGSRLVSRRSRPARPGRPARRAPPGTTAQDGTGRRPARRRPRTVTGCLRAGDTAGTLHAHRRRRCRDAGGAAGRRRRAATAAGTGAQPAPGATGGAGGPKAAAPMSITLTCSIPASIPSSTSATRSKSPARVSAAAAAAAVTAAAHRHGDCRPRATDDRRRRPAPRRRRAPAARRAPAPARRDRHGSGRRARSAQMTVTSVRHDLGELQLDPRFEGRGPWTRFSGRQLAGSTPTFRAGAFLRPRLDSTIGIDHIDHRKVSRQSWLVQSGKAPSPSAS